MTSGRALPKLFPSHQPVFSSGGWGNVDPYPQKSSVWISPRAGYNWGGVYLGDLPGGRGNSRVGVLELWRSMDSVGYRRGLSVGRQGQVETEAHTHAILPSPISPATLPPHSLRCSVPLGPPPGFQAGPASARPLLSTGAVVSCWQGGSLRREGVPGLRSRKPPREGMWPRHRMKSEVQR